MTSKNLSRIGFFLVLGAILALLSLRFIIPVAVIPENTENPEAIQEFINRWLGVGSIFACILVAGFLLWTTAGFISWKQKRMLAKTNNN
jgi:hypothetical protein